MLNTIKWELLKWYYRLRWIMLFLLVVLGVSVMLSILGAFSNPNTFTVYMLKGISLLFSGFVFLFCILLPSVNMIIDYILPHKYMESTIQRKQETVICAKLFVNAVVFYIGAAIGLLGNLVFENVILDGEKVFWITGDKGVHIILYIILGIFVPIIVMFFYMLTYCIKAEIKHRILLMIVLMVTTFAGLYLLSKVALISKIFEVGGVIVLILIVTNLKIIIEKKYEPR